MKVSVGFIVIKNGRPLATGGSWQSTVKAYRTKSPASRLANKRGGTVYEAFIEIEEEGSA